MTKKSVSDTSTVEATITDLAHGGFGIARVKGQVCFIPYALPGDQISIKVTRTMRGYIWGSIETILTPSPARLVSAPCPVFGRCGGCSWLHFSYPDQAKWKQHIVAECFRRITGISVEPEWTEDESLRLGYRTRAEFHCDATNWGFYERQSHRVIPITSCPLCHPAVNSALNKIKSISTLNSVEVTANPDTGDVLVWSKQPCRELEAMFPSFDYPNSNKPRASFSYDGAVIVNGTFSQSSLLLNRLLVRVVRNLVGSPDNLLDLYCGNGNLSLAYASSIPVVGLDHNEEAIQSVPSRALGDYRVASEEKFQAALQEKTWDVVLLDPPRKGAKTLMPALASCKTGAIVYVSCDPATLARDAQILLQNGWKISQVNVVDMFPHTHHIETVARFVR